jgi:hypothetical protein
MSGAIQIDERKVRVRKLSGNVFCSHSWNTTNNVLKHPPDTFEVELLSPLYTEWV